MKKKLTEQTLFCLFLAFSTLFWALKGLRVIGNRVTHELVEQSDPNFSQSKNVNKECVGEGDADAVCEHVEGGEGPAEEECDKTQPDWPTLPSYTKLRAQRNQLKNKQIHRQSLIKTKNIQ